MLFTRIPGPAVAASCNENHVADINWKKRGLRSCLEVRVFFVYESMPAAIDSRIASTDSTSMPR
jgi:hypothetical protein